MRLILGILSFWVGFNASAVTFGEPKTQSLSFEHRSLGVHKVDMGTTHFSGILYDYLVARVSKKKGEKLEVTDIVENLGYCTVVGIVQSEISTVADITIHFDVENDGGFNSCAVVMQTGFGEISLELGAEVGE